MLAHVLLPCADTTLLLTVQAIQLFVQFGRRLYIAVFTRFCLGCG